MYLLPKPKTIKEQDGQMLLCHSTDSLNVSNQLSIHEDTSYMRDYVFEEGRLKEVHFDKVSK